MCQGLAADSDWPGSDRWPLTRRTASGPWHSVTRTARRAPATVRPPAGNQDRGGSRAAAAVRCSDGRGRAWRRHHWPTRIMMAAVIAGVTVVTTVTHWPHTRPVTGPGSLKTRARVGRTGTVMMRRSPVEPPAAGRWPQPPAGLQARAREHHDAGGGGGRHGPGQGPWRRPGQRPRAGITVNPGQYTWRKRRREPGGRSEMGPGSSGFRVARLFDSPGPRRHRDRTWLGRRSVHRTTAAAAPAAHSLCGRPGHGRAAACPRGHGPGEAAGRR
jgi:hypothetical protein